MRRRHGRRAALLSKEPADLSENWGDVVISSIGYAMFSNWTARNGLKFCC